MKFVLTDPKVIAPDRRLGDLLLLVSRRVVTSEDFRRGLDHRSVLGRVRAVSLVFPAFVDQRGFDGSEILKRGFEYVLPLFGPEVVKEAEQLARRVENVKALVPSSRALSRCP